MKVDVEIGTNDNAKIFFIRFFIEIVDTLILKTCKNTERKTLLQVSISTAGR